MRTAAGIVHCMYFNLAGAYIRFTNLKLKNPDMKALLGIGGWNEGSTKYSEVRFLT